MDKYEYNLKLEEIDKLVEQQNYEEAAKLADTIEWKRVRNVRTLCLISEIYEAAGRLEESKALLIRAYKRSPVGRTVLYRLVQVSTALQQYDEAIEYYSEYVQLSPHDTNRYILKYKIYKGRGSQIEELILILEEYLSQEYTERWAYELATLYQQAGQMQKCFATCDDLVLWFHSGKYVKKALELKKRYTQLTPKQVQIYEECLLANEDAPEPVSKDETEAAEATAESPSLESSDGEVIAETILAQTEKEIASSVTATKAELDKTAAPEPQVEAAATIQIPDVKEKNTEEAAAEKSVPEEAKVEKTVAEKTTVEETAPEKTAVDEAKAAELKKAETKEEPAAAEDDSARLLGLEIARTVQSALAKKNKNTADLVVEEVSVAEPETKAAKAEESEKAEAVPQADDAETLRDRQVEMAKNMRKIIAGVIKPQEEDDADIPDTVGAKIQSMQKLNIPEKPDKPVAKLSIDDILLSMSDQGRRVADAVLEEEAAKAQAEEEARLARELAERERALAEEAKAEVPEVRTVKEAAEKELTDIQREALQYTSHPEKLLRNKRSLPTYSEDNDTKEDNDVNAAATIRIPAEEVKETLAQKALDEVAAVSEEAPTEELVTAVETGEEAAAENPAEAAIEAGTESNAPVPGIDPDGEEKNQPEEVAEPEVSVQEEAAAKRVYREGERLSVPEHLKRFFGVYAEVDGLGDQIANAIIQAEAKGTDRTSRSGNILIFGGHGSGKTTIAVGIARAVAQDKGSQVMKIAKIYAADLNRKDIAATVAKIAGGVLIIEEAGDLEPNTVDQLTTAMEFRTDGLIVILEDEQKYVHELLMQHPRFTMKFTAQIYVPVYTVDELAAFAQEYAMKQDYVFGEEALIALKAKISATASAKGVEVSLIEVIEMVNNAIARSNKFFRKITMGKKRYDENDYVILFPKDIK